MQSYDINANLNDEDDRLKLLVTVKVKNKTNTSFSALYFRNPAQTMVERAKDVSSLNKACKAKISSVKNLTSKKKLAFSSDKRDKSIVKVKLGGKRLKPGATMKIRIAARIDIPRADGRFGYSADDKGNGLLYYLSLCYPQLADYRAGSWSLNPFPEQGENRYARVTDYSVTFTAPRGYKVAATGVSHTRKGVTRVNARKVRDFALVACDYMKKDVAKVCGVKVVNWYLPGAHATEYRKTTMTALKDAISYLSAHVGCSPFPEIDVVQAFGGAGNLGWADMEHSGLITLAGDRYYYDWGPVDGSLASLAGTTYHEMAHQWFYAAVGNDEYNEPWLDEGMAAYCNKWAMWKGVTDTARCLAGETPVDTYVADRRASFRTAVSSVEERTGITKLDGGVSSYDDYFSTIYGTSVWFLIQLEEQVGEQAFDSIMQDYFRTYCQKEASTSGFLSVVRKHAASPNVETLLKKYFSQ